MNASAPPNTPWGRCPSRRKCRDKTKTITYHGDDIHDFAWTASPRSKVKDDGVFQGEMGPVQMRILMQPAHWSQVGGGTKKF